MLDARYLMLDNSESIIIPFFNRASSIKDPVSDEFREYKMKSSNTSCRQLGSMRSKHGSQ